MLKTIGPYEITGTLGEGGMGVVYAARDARLDRPVALKMLRLAESDPVAGERLRREARAAALVNHPNVCQLYDIGEQDGRLFIAMEYLEGESLAARLGRGPIPPPEAVRIALAILSALTAIHQRDLIHRDLKPSNVFLTPHAVKLLDFGLACASGQDPAETRMTRPGTLVGTPQYLAPEGLRGEPVDPRGDIFAAGAVLYEMLAGRPAFARASMAETIHAIAYEHPPALGGSAGVAAIDRVVHKAMAKRPTDRYTSAPAMADDLRAAMLAADSGGIPTPVRPMTRLIVLPFRVLRADPEIDFLSFGLADGLTLSLSGFDSLIVRSTLTASSPADAGDLTAIADKAGVDAVLTGTLLRAGDQLRVTSQLVELPGGTVRWSQSTQVRLGDVFALQDELTERIVESLALPLSARESGLQRRDVPATARAYECYLRANQLAYQAREWRVARDLYRDCLAEDPQYAPAWARLGRIYRVLAMYGEEEAEQQYALAEEAFRRALAINPDLPLAHNLFTALEIEAGRPGEAMRRLLGRVRAQSADPDLFAGLVQACRYAGLDRPAIAAYEHARRLDPHIRTAVSHAYLAAGHYGRAIETDADDPPVTALVALDLLSRGQEAIDRLRRYGAAPMPPVYRFFLDFTLAVFEKDRVRGRAAADPLLNVAPRDPCAKYYIARGLALIEHPRALDTLEAAVRGGFHSYGFFMRDPWLDPIRTTSRFRQIVAFAEERYRDAVHEYTAAGGERILGSVSRD